MQTVYATTLKDLKRSKNKVDVSWLAVTASRDPVIMLSLRLLKSAQTHQSFKRKFLHLLFMSSSSRLSSKRSNTTTVCHKVYLLPCSRRTCKTCSAGSALSEATAVSLIATSVPLAPKSEVPLAAKKRPVAVVNLEAMPGSSTAAVPHARLTTQTNCL